MSEPQRVARWQSRVLCVAGAVCIASGCTNLLPTAESWEKWSPSNLAFYLQPHELNRLSEQNCQPIADAYYSISDSRGGDEATARKSPDVPNAGTAVVPPDAPTTPRQGAPSP